MKTAAICIATCYRDAGLATLLLGLRNQRVPDGWDIQIRVVCNEPDADRKAFANRVVSIIPSAIVAFEPRQNIAHARNAAIMLGPADAYLFIDDDEIPGPCWLISLLARLDDKDVGAVFGPVIGRQHGHASRWLEESGAFDKMGPDHDGNIPWTQSRTSSAAVRGSLLGPGASLFDSSYGISGGSDTELFRRLEMSGARFVHERAAYVFEDNAPSRTSCRAVLKRRYRAGVVFGRMHLRDDHIGALNYTATRSAWGAFLMLTGLLPTLFGNPGRLFYGSCRIACAIGAWRGRKASYQTVRYPTRPVTP